MAKSTNNYNIDFRRLFKEKLKNWKFVLVAVIGSALTLIPWALKHDTTFVSDSGFPLSIGLLICWWMLLMAYVGVVLFPFDEKKAREFAAKHKLQFLLEGVDLRLLSGLRTVNLFDPSNKKHQTIAGVMFGNTETQPQFEILIARYNFEYKAGIRNNLYQFSAIVLDTRIKNFPEFIIDSRAIYDFKRFVQPSLKEKVALEGSFGTRYDVYVTPGLDNQDRLLALSVLTPDFMQEFMQHLDGTNMIVEDGRIILLTRKDVYYLDKYEEYLATLTSLYTKIERQVKLRDKLANSSLRDENGAPITVQ